MFNMKIENVYSQIYDPRIKSHLNNSLIWKNVMQMEKNYLKILHNKHVWFIMQYFIY